MSERRTITVTAPAKINLGLEILGKRDDGYHEIRTILATIGIADTLSFSLVPDRSDTHISGVSGVPQSDNLIQKAIDAFAMETGTSFGYDVAVEKRIPSPGGLGGASSNAASTLLALNALHGTPLQGERLSGIAAKLGSDVPFFLGTPVALASGTGTTLESLPPIAGYIVLVAPRMTLEAKTARLYGSLTPRDFTDGTGVERAATTIRGGHVPNPDALGNAFSRPLYALYPGLRDLASRIISAGAPNLSLSGAGPAHYVLLQSGSEADRLAEDLRRHLPGDTLVASVPFGVTPAALDRAGW